MCHSLQAFMEAALSGSFGGVARMIEHITLLPAEQTSLPDPFLVCFPSRSEWEALHHPFLVCFPMRSEWDALHPVIAETFPEPSVTSDDPVPDRMPGPVSRLVRLAELKGWTVAVTYSKGHEPHATHGTPSTKPKEKWAIRMVRGQRSARAVRTDDTWTSLWDWSPDQFMQRSVSLAVFERVLD